MTSTSSISAMALMSTENNSSNSVITFRGNFSELVEQLGVAKQSYNSNFFLALSAGCASLAELGVTVSAEHMPQSFRVQLEVSQLMARLHPNFQTYDYYFLQQAYAEAAHYVYQERKHSGKSMVLDSLVCFALMLHVMCKNFPEMAANLCMLEQRDVRVISDSPCISLLYCKEGISSLHLGHDSRRDFIDYILKNQENVWWMSTNHIACNIVNFSQVKDRDGVYAGICDVFENLGLHKDSQIDLSVFTPFQNTSFQNNHLPRYLGDDNRRSLTH